MYFGGIMNNYFKYDFKRAFFSKYNFIAIFIVFLISVIEIKYANISQNELKNNAISMMLIVLNMGQISLLTLLCPLVICIPYVSSYIQDKENGFIYFILSRHRKETYLKIRIIVNAIISFLVLFIPLIIIYGILLIFKGLPIDLFDRGKITGLFADIYYSTPIIYPVLCILGYSIFGAIYGTFALGLSTIINNKYLSLIIPNVIYIGSSLIAPMIGMSFNINFDFILINLVDITLSDGILSFVFYHTVLFLIGLYLFYYKNVEERAYNE